MILAISAVLILTIPWYIAQNADYVRPISTGKVVHIVDGDTLDVRGIGRVRLVGVNTPEKEEEGYSEALDYLEMSCLGRTVDVDIDDECPKDAYGRILGVVYVEGTNINAQLLRLGHAQVLYLPPSEFDPELWLE
jgi:micrococcal nuclease